MPCGTTHAGSASDTLAAGGPIRRPWWDRDPMANYEPCKCVAYNWPHRPGGGLCNWPDEPEYRLTNASQSASEGTRFPSCHTKKRAERPCGFCTHSVTQRELGYLGGMSYREKSGTLATSVGSPTPSTFRFSEPIRHTHSWPTVRALRGSQAVLRLIRPVAETSAGTVRPVVGDALARLIVGTSIVIPPGAAIGRLPST